MATLTVRHSKVSAVADSADTTLIQPSDWNDDHAATLSGLVASDISDSTTAGRDLLTAANAAAQRTALGLATVASSGSATDLGSGTLASARLPTTADMNARVAVRKNSTGSDFTRRRINFIEGSNVTLTVADDSGNEEVDVTIAASGGGGSGSITASGYTQNTARLLGRTTASSGAIEEITVGSGLSLSAGSLTATGGGGVTITSLYKSANQSIANNTTTLVTWNSEFVDDDGAHSTSSNTSRITVPSGKTLARFTVVVSWAINNANSRYVFLEKNSAGVSTAANQVLYWGFNPTSASYDYGTMTMTTGWITVTATDYYEVFAFQNSGGSLDLIGGTLPRGSVFTAEFK